MVTGPLKLAGLNETIPKEPVGSFNTEKPQPTYVVSAGTEYVDQLDQNVDKHF